MRLCAADRRRIPTGFRLWPQRQARRLAGRSPRLVGGHRGHDLSVDGSRSRNDGARYDRPAEPGQPRRRADLGSDRLIFNGMLPNDRSIQGVMMTESKAKSKAKATSRANKSRKSAARSKSPPKAAAKAKAGGRKAKP